MKKIISTFLPIILCSGFLLSCKKSSDSQPSPSAQSPSNLSYSSNVIHVPQGSSANSVKPDIKGTTPMQYKVTSIPANNGSISINNDGVISINNSAAAGTYQVSVTASNAAGSVGFNNVYEIIVDATPTAPSSLSYGSDTLTIEQGSSTVSSSLPQINGTSPIHYALSSPPSFISINDSTGVVQVSPGLSIGSYPLTISASNSAGSTTFNNAFVVKIVASGSPAQFSYSPNHLSTPDDVNSNSVAPSIVGNATLSYTLSSNPTASSISIDNNTGVITVGSSTPVGTYTLTITASNSIGSTTTTYNVTVVPSFGLDILPLMTNYCTSCHNGTIQHTNFNSYSVVQTYSSTILTRIQEPPTNSQFMPQGGTPLSTEEINLIKQWQTTGMKQ